MSVLHGRRDIQVCCYPRPTDNQLLGMCRHVVSAGDYDLLLSWSFQLTGWSRVIVLSVPMLANLPARFAASRAPDWYRSLKRVLFVAVSYEAPLAS